MPEKNKIKATNMSDPIFIVKTTLLKSMSFEHCMYIQQGWFVDLSVSVTNNNRCWLDSLFLMFPPAPQLNSGFQ